MSVLHVDDGKVVAREAGDLGKGWGEAEEEDAIEDFAFGEAGFEGLGSGSLDRDFGR